MLILDMEHTKEEAGPDQVVRDWARKFGAQARRRWAIALGRESRPPTEAHGEPEDPDRATGLIL